MAYRAAEVFCLPSLFEAFPMSVLEAAIMRTPIILTTRAAIPGLRNGVEVLYTAPDPSDIARNLSILLGDTELRTELAENAFLRVREAFGPVRVARKLQEVYRTATGAKEP